VKKALKICSISLVLTIVYHLFLYGLTEGRVFANGWLPLPGSFRMVNDTIFLIQLGLVTLVFFLLALILYKWRSKTILIGVGLSLIALFLFERHVVIESRAGSALTSCRNHMSFVAMAFDRHVNKEGWLPYNSKLTGEELICHIDFLGTGQNCHHGAPQQWHGGWQMINAPKEVWDKIIEEMSGETIPVVWCGGIRPIGGEKMRIVVALNQLNRPYKTIDEYIKGNTFGKRFSAFWGSTNIS
jgi:hypothetical protein